MTLSQEDRRTLIQHRIEKANLTIQEVEFQIDKGYLPTAVNRIYYGIYYILSALALQRQFKTSKHLQLIGWFNKNFVKTGIVEKELSVVVRKAFDMRCDGDYEDFITFSQDEVETIFEQMKAFVVRIEKLISEKT